MPRSDVRGQCKRCSRIAVLLRLALTIGGRKVVDEDLCETCAGHVGTRVIDTIY